MEPQKIMDNVTLTFGSGELTGDVYRTAYINTGAPALLLKTARGQEHLSVNLDSHGLVPGPRSIFVKDYSGHNGLADSMVKAGIGTITGKVSFGDFGSEAYELELVL